MDAERDTLATFKQQLCAIVVTYNRCACLRKTLAALEPFGIDVLIVNNASTDDTAAYLETLPKAAPWHLLTLPENIGGSGGFAAGMRWAIKQGYQWLWVMDDDVLPLPGILEVFARHAAPRTCLNPSKRTAEGDIFEFEGAINAQTLHRRRLPHATVFREAEAVPCTTACFEGMCVSADLAQEIIEPWADFFIAWDDILFGMLAAQRGRNLYLKAFGIQKQFDKTATLAGGLRYHSSLFGRYYHLRNFLFTSRYLREHNLGGRFIWPRYAYEWCKACALTLLEGRIRGVKLLILAWWRGLHRDTTPPPKEALCN